MPHFEAFVQVVTGSNVFFFQTSWCIWSWMPLFIYARSQGQILVVIRKETFFVYGSISYILYEVGWGGVNATKWCIQRGIWLKIIKYIAKNIGQESVRQTGLHDRTTAVFTSDKQNRGKTSVVMRDVVMVWFIIVIVGYCKNGHSLLWCGSVR